LRGFSVIAKFYKDCVASVTANHLPYEVNSAAMEDTKR
jgi:hypothetical protein